MTLPFLQNRELTYEDVRDYLKPFVEQGGWTGNKAIVFSGDPYDETQKLGAQSIVYISVGGGAGLVLEQLFDRPFIRIRVVSRQFDFTDGERLALFVDKCLLVVNSSRKVSGKRVNYITRIGGRPELLLKDAGDRYHFIGTYITESETGL